MSKKNKTYFMKPNNDRTLYRVDKNKSMNVLLMANWAQIQKDFDAQVRAHSAAATATGMRERFIPKPIQLVLSNKEYEVICKALKSSGDEGIKVFYNSEQFHLCSFINEDRAKEIGDKKNAEAEAEA